MLKWFNYRLYPTKRPQRLLSEQLEEVRWLWDTLLAERKQAWEERREAVDYYEQKAELPGLKADVRPGLKQVHSQVVQEVALRVKKAMGAFFRRLKAGETPGYPRFRGPGRYDSLTYPQWDNGVKLSASGKRLLLSKVGDVKIILHRPFEGTPKTATIRRTATGKWYVTIACEWEPTPLPATGGRWASMWGLRPSPPLRWRRQSPTRASFGARSRRWRERSARINWRWMATKPHGPV